MSYVYRFLNEENQVIYVGKAKEIESRINSHFNKGGHLNKECYQETKKVEYIKTGGKTETEIKEKYYICKYKPKWNKNGNRENDVVSFELPKENWLIINHHRIKKINEEKYKTGRPTSCLLNREKHHEIKEYCKNEKMNLEDFCINAINYFFEKNVEVEKMEINQTKRNIGVVCQVNFRIDEEKTILLKVEAFKNRVGISDFLEGVLIEYFKFVSK